MPQLPKIYFQRLLSISPDIIIAVDREGSIIFYNDGAEQTLGYSARDLVDRHVQDLYTSLEEARRVMRAMRDNPVGSSKNCETLLRSKSGEDIPVTISGSLIRDEDGEEIGSIGFAKDLREIRRRDRLATLGEVAVGLAHEINNPLEAIANQLELVGRFLSSKCDDEEYVVEGERMESVERELDKIRTTVERIQSMAADGNYETCEYLPGRLMADLKVRGQEAARSAEAVAQPPQKASPNGSPNGGEDLGALRVLVVDDDLGVCNSLRDLLLEQECQVMTASDGLEALDVLEHEPVDVVLSDVVMPDMDGYDLFMELKERSPDLPVVLMTAYYFDKDHVIKRSRLEGLGQVIFKKPIDPRRVKSILVDACQSRTAAAATEKP